MLTPKDADHHYQIDHITNGVHARTWAAPSFANLFDKWLTGWREDSASLRGVLAIPGIDVWNAHQSAKLSLIDEINSRHTCLFDPETRSRLLERRSNRLAAEPPT